MTRDKLVDHSTDLVLAVRRYLTDPSLSRRWR